MAIEPGAEVIWASQAGSYTKVKIGTVIAFLPAWCDIRDPKIWDKPLLPEGTRPTDLVGDPQSKNPRYLVAVEKRHKRTGKLLRMLYYTPLASVIEKQNGQEMRRG